MLLVVVFIFSALNETSCNFEHEHHHTVVLREAWATLPESSSQPLPATLAQSHNLAHASLETAVGFYSGFQIVAGRRIHITLFEHLQRST